MRWIPILVLGFLLNFQSQVHGYDYGRLRGESQGSTHPYTLYYLFSPDEAAHHLHAEELEALSRSLRRNLQVVRIARLEQASDGDSYSLPGFRRHQGFPGKLLSWVELTEKKRSAAMLTDQLSEEENFALLFDRKGELVASGTGGDLSRILSAIPLEVTRTEVDESTWGKIKELFR